MRKLLLVLALVAAIPIHGQEQSPKTNKTQQKTNTASDQPQQPPVIIIDSGNGQPQAQTDGNRTENQPQNYFRVLFSPNNLPTDALVLVGFLTLYLLRFQAVETRKAAQAALLNAEALIKAERPWLVINCGPISGRPNDYFVEAVNVGRTPADICEARCVFAVHPMDFTGPSERDLEVPPVQLLHTFLVTGKEIELGVCKNVLEFLQHEIFRQAYEGELTPSAQGHATVRHAVFMYGWISYRNTFTDRSKPNVEPNRSQWIFRWNPHEVDPQKKLTKPASEYESHK